ncbi:DUF4185 domain-containing protein [Silvibacterium sp.]|uniref:DUF4185 domain-containing protein n=1 Tax=Silvibacterium sp. TaxID=1964179 RepID=UPI0039E54B7D
MHRIVLAAVWIVVCFSAAHAQSGASWPEADRLFHADPRWLGADGAFSVDLGEGRVLWIFNDSFVAKRQGDDRRHAAFVHNTVAIQQGYDPSRATIHFYWRTKQGAPSEIYPNEGDVWMWPSSGIRVGSRLLLFATRVGADHAPHSLGFKLLGWNAYWVDNPDEEPSAWTLRVVEQRNDAVVMASSLVRKGAYVYAFGASEPQHDLYVARMQASSLEKGELGTIEWWTGSGWDASDAKRKAIASDTGTETSVQADPRGGGYIGVYSKGFGGSIIVMQTAKELTGPWSASMPLYRPPESDAPGAFVYAGKSHAELQGADLVLTYAANGPDEKVLGDMRLYFPRFVRVNLKQP